MNIQKVQQQMPIRRNFFFNFFLFHYQIQFSITFLGYIRNEKCRLSPQHSNCILNFCRATDLRFVRDYIFIQLLLLIRINNLSVARLTVFSSVCFLFCFSVIFTHQLSIALITQLINVTIFEFIHPKYNRLFSDPAMRNICRYINICLLIAEPTNIHQLVDWFVKYGTCVYTLKFTGWSSSFNWFKISSQKCIAVNINNNLDNSVIDTLLQIK